MDKQCSDPSLVVFEICKDPMPKQIGWNEFLTARKDSARLFFIQALNHNHDHLQQWLQAIDADPLIMERCIDPDSISGIFSYEHMFVLQLPVAADWEKSQHPKLTLVCLGNALILISEAFLFSANSFLPKELLPSVFRQTDMAGMLLVLLDGVVDHSSYLMLQVRHAVDRLEGELLEKEGGFDKRLLDCKRALAHFDIAFEEKYRTLRALLSADASPVDLSKIHERLLDVAAHIEHSQRYVERLEDRLSELHHHLTLQLQEKTNQRLRFLTILSAIFMPMTLVAGIYGMNFRYMPELNWNYGYPLALLLMLCIAIFMLWYFTRKGWFR